MTISITRLNKPQSIYVRTDYIVNSDMSIPFALARGMLASIASEAQRRTGLPMVDRAPQPSPLVMARANLKGKDRG